MSIILSEIDLHTFCTLVLILSYISMSY